MLTKFSDIQNEVIRRAAIQTTAAGISDAMIGAWIQQAHRWATSFRKWPFTQGRTSTTWTATEEWAFEGYKADAIRMIVIGGDRLQKLNYEDYLIMQENDSDASDRVFSNIGRLVVINPNADVSGTLYAYGQYAPADIDITDDTATTVFSNGDEEGNEAIVLETISYIKTRQQKDKESQFYHQRAEGVLGGLWDKVKDEQFAYQTHRTRDGMFKRFDVLAGGFNDDLLKRDQFPLG